MFHALNFNTENVYFWSDIHYSHAQPFILEPRGFKTVWESDKELLNRLNKKVGKNDILFLLGDTVLAKQNSFDKLEELFGNINCETIFCMGGNHFGGLKRFVEKYWVGTNTEFMFHELDFRGKRIKIISNYFEIEVCGQFIVLSHYPILSWNKKPRSSFALFGHVHGGLNKSEECEFYIKGKVLDVGVESCPEPISFNEVCAYMENRKNPELIKHF
jgi:calcineurin-like phosphoesterase family protein